MTTELEVKMAKALKDLITYLPSIPEGEAGRAELDAAWKCLADLDQKILERSEPRLTRVQYEGPALLVALRAMFDAFSGARVLETFVVSMPGDPKVAACELARLAIEAAEKTEPPPQRRVLHAQAQYEVTDDGHGRALVDGVELSYEGVGVSIGDNIGHPVKVGAKVIAEILERRATLVRVLP